LTFLKVRHCMPPTLLQLVLLLLLPLHILYSPAHLCQ
jgi:hypothetical protein